MTSCTHQGVQLSVMNILHTTKCGATFCTHHKVWSHFLYSPQSVLPHSVLTTKCGATFCTHQVVQLSVMNILHTTKCGATFCTHHKVWSHFLHSPSCTALSDEHSALKKKCGATSCTHHKVCSHIEYIHRKVCRRIPYSPQSVEPHSVLTTNCGAAFRTHHKVWSHIPYSPQSVEPHSVLTTKCGATCCTHHKVWSPRSGRHSRNKKRPVCKVFGFCCRGFLCNRRQGREETNQYK